MFVISAGQLRRLFNLSDDFRADSLLDLGAGDGATTSLIAPVSPTRRTLCVWIWSRDVPGPIIRMRPINGIALQNVQ